ncbi:MAG: alpha/beta hydrolase [Chloroflexi bacterium]|nr:alpha/beta hydrolase [Chloroflexota bacterium]
MATTTGKVWTEKHAHMSHGETRYWEAGAGTPTILLHGAGWNSGCENWSLTIAPLAEHLHVFAMDCLNWGTGDVLDQEFSFAYLVDHVREFMDVVGIDRANVVGHSMGGWILTLLSYESPNRVRKAINVAGGGAATRPLRNMVEFTVPAPDQIREHYRRLAVASGGALEVDDLAGPYIAKRDLPGHAAGFAKVMRHMTNPITRQRYNTLRRLPFITVPTLVMWGREDPVNSLEEVGLPTAKGIPGAQLIVYDNTGHSVPWEQPERFPRDVLEFLRA